MKTKRKSPYSDSQLPLILLLLVGALLLSACSMFDDESTGSVARATAQEAAPVAVDNSPVVPEAGAPLSSSNGQAASSDAAATPYATYLPLTAVSQGYSWTRTNPGGGGAFNVVGAGPSGNSGQPGIILAGSDLAGAYISHDQGNHWELIGLYRGLDDTHVSGIGFDPNNYEVLFIGTETGIYRSENGGATVQNVLDDGYITDIELAATDSAVGYATFHSAYNAADGVIYKTVDNGRSWKQISNSSLPTGHHILKIIVDPNNENKLYLLTGEGRFTCGTAVAYQSVDGGTNWTQIADSVGQIMDIALNPNDSDMLYVSSYGDVWDEGYDCISDDLSGGFLHRGIYSGVSGWQWQQVTNGGNVGSRNALIWLDSDDQQAIRLIDLEALELWESVDDGSSWTLISSGDSWGNGWTDHAYGGSFNGDTLTLGTDMSDPDALLWIDSQFAYATRDNGRYFDNIYTHNQGEDTWQSAGIDNIIMVDLAIDADSTHLYAALADMGCFRSEDYGNSWQSCNDPAYTEWWASTGGNSATVEADPTEAGSVWITQAGEMTDFPHSLLHSDDFGASWREIISWGNRSPIWIER